MHLKITIGLSLLSLFFVSCNSSNSERKYTSKKDALFSLMSAGETSIDFINRVEDGEDFNILTYRNFYNGGGVSIGDINNDSLPDVYFTANSGKNRLYLNQGNFKFKDITDQANVAGKEAWSTGSTMVDVNNDGWLDIYVCNSGDVKGNDKKNELFINNRDLTFTNKAADYNLDNRGFTTHASFFDYDLDGDLDCYILNNSFIQTTNIELYRVARNSVDDEGGDKLYRNDGNVFKDVTGEAGIYSSKIGFGLGISVSDLNNDYLPDIYVSNDFWERDYLYINKGDGTFSEELIDHMSICSMSSMGADIADINNDGYPEIFSTDMLAADNYRLQAMTLFEPYHVEDMKFRANYHYQMLQNSLHLNKGDLDFQEVAFLSGVASTDWSWGALMFDFDNDGQKDIFVSNGIAKDIMYLDFSDFIADKENIRNVITRTGRVDWRDFLPHLPSTKLSNYAFINHGNLQFVDASDSLGLGEPSFSNGAAYGDLDNDGDLDLVINNVNMPAFVYRNNAERRSGNNYLKVRFQGAKQNPMGVGATVTAFMGGEKITLQNYTSRGFESSVEPVLTFGLGKSDQIDSIQVVWPDRNIQVFYDVPVNQTLTCVYKESSIQRKDRDHFTGQLFAENSGALGLDRITHSENEYNDFNDEPLLLRMFSTEGPKMIQGDANGDGREDFILLGAANDNDKLMIQTAEHKFVLKSTPYFEKDSVFESTCGALLDIENDGDLDLFIGSGGNEPGKSLDYYTLRVYINDGNGNFSRSDLLSEVKGNFSCIKVSDFDRNGYTDLFIGARIVPGNYGVIPRSYLISNEGGDFKDISTELFGKMGMVTDAAWSDPDSDGDNDLIVVGDWMPVTIVQNDEGVLSKKSTVRGSAGWWNTIKTADLDQDGDDDYVIGNWGLNTKFRASKAKPLTMYVKDFDKNSKTEFVINWHAPLDAQAYPFATKKEITQQLPILKKTVLKYEKYAQKTYETLFPEEVRRNAISYKTETLGSAVLWNEKGELVLKDLPLPAQVSPVFAVAVADFDGNKTQDIWLGGNFYNLKPQVGRQNSSKGVMLMGRGNRRFEYLHTSETGLEVDGEVRDVNIMRVGDEEVLIISRNDKTPTSYKLER